MKILIFLNLIIFIEASQAIRNLKNYFKDKNCKYCRREYKLLDDNFPEATTCQNCSNSCESEPISHNTELADKNEKSILWGQPIEMNEQSFNILDVSLKGEKEVESFNLDAIKRDSQAIDESSLQKTPKSKSRKREATMDYKRKLRTKESINMQSKTNMKPTNKERKIQEKLKKVSATDNLKTTKKRSNLFILK